jgi:hypothetical protein
MKIRIEFAIVKSGRLISYRTQEEAKAKNTENGKIFRIKVLG